MTHFMRNSLIAHALDLTTALEVNFARGDVEGCKQVTARLAEILKYVLKEG